MQTVPLCSDTSALRRRFQVSLPTIDLRIFDLPNLACLVYMWIPSDFSEVLSRGIENSSLVAYLAQIPENIVKIWHVNTKTHFLVEEIFKMWSF